jgi:hypothetical protein
MGIAREGPSSHICGALISTSRQSQFAGQALNVLAKLQMSMIDCFAMDPGQQSRVEFDGHGKMKLCGSTMSGSGRVDVYFTIAPTRTIEP